MEDCVKQSLVTGVNGTELRDSGSGLVVIFPMVRESDHGE